jgi:hypothetical protein
VACHLLPYKPRLTQNDRQGDGNNVGGAERRAARGMYHYKPIVKSICVQPVLRPFRAAGRAAIRNNQDPSPRACLESDAGVVSMGVAVAAPAVVATGNGVAVVLVDGAGLNVNAGDAPGYNMSWRWLLRRCQTPTWPWHPQ